MLRLDAESRLELISAIERSLREERIALDVLNEIDRRVGQMGSAPSADAIPSDEFLRRLRARSSA